MVKKKTKAKAEAHPETGPPAGAPEPQATTPAPVARKARPGRLPVPTVDEQKKVLELRQSGMTFLQIDDAMGWGRHKGMRSWRIVNDPRAFRGQRTRRRAHPARRYANGTVPQAPEGFERITESARRVSGDLDSMAQRQAAPVAPRQDERDGFGRRQEDRLGGMLLGVLMEVIEYNHAHNHRSRLNH